MVLGWGENAEDVLGVGFADARNGCDVGEWYRGAETGLVWIFVDGEQIGSENEEAWFPASLPGAFALYAPLDFPALDHPIKTEAAILVYRRECTDVEVTCAVRG